MASAGNFVLDFCLTSGGARIIFPKDAIERAGALDTVRTEALLMELDELDKVEV